MKAPKPRQEGQPQTCPKCRADDQRYIEFIRAIRLKDGRLSLDYACALCGHAWTVTP